MTAGRRLRSSARWRLNQLDGRKEPRLAHIYNQNCEERRSQAEAFHSVPSLSALHRDLLSRRRSCHVLLERGRGQSSPIRRVLRARRSGQEDRSVGERKRFNGSVPLLVRVSKYCFLFHATCPGNLVLHWNNKLSFRKKKHIHSYARRLHVLIDEENQL